MLREKMVDDMHETATSDDLERVGRVLEAVVDLVAAVDLAFNGQDSREAERPIAAKQLRYSRAMRAVGDLLKSAGRADLQRPFYELAEALHDQAEGRHHTLFDIDDSVRPGRGKGADRHDVWRLRANLCAGIRWLMAAGQAREDAIKQVVRAHRRQLSKLERSGTKALESAIGGWLDRFEAPTPDDNAVAAALYREEKKEIEARREVMSSAELMAAGLERIREAARGASKLLKLDKTRPRSKPERI
jgi:hypothetical protein